MAALGEVFILFIYISLGAFNVFFLVFIFVWRKALKPFAVLGCVMYAYLFFSFKSCQDNIYKNQQRSRVGIYYLTNYPNCPSCVLELKEDNTYRVTSEEKQLEQGDWHYEVGGDYFIVYMNNDTDQLDHGRFEYTESILKYGEIEK